MPEAKCYREVFNSDRVEYGGSGVVNEGDLNIQKESMHGFHNSLCFRLPPLGTAFFAPVDLVKAEKPAAEKAENEVLPESAPVEEASASAAPMEEPAPVKASKPRAPRKPKEPAAEEPVKKTRTRKKAEPEAQAAPKAAKKPAAKKAASSKEEKTEETKAKKAAKEPAKKTTTRKSRAKKDTDSTKTPTES